MKAKSKNLVLMLLLAGLLLTGLVVLNGCKKSEPAAPPEETPEEAASATIEQTTCPIMEGNAINKALFTEYKGKKVYFCCPGCKPKFEKNPEKYLAKLPQFQN